MLTDQGQEQQPGGKQQEGLAEILGGERRQGLFVARDPLALGGTRFFGGLALAVKQGNQGGEILVAVQEHLLPLLF